MAHVFLSSRVSAQDGNLHYYHLPKGMVKLSVMQRTSGNQVSYKLQAPEVSIVPDPAHRYYFQYQPGFFSHDVINLGFSPEGFLKSVHTTIEDQRGDVVRKVIELGSAAAEAVVAGGASRTRGLQAEEGAEILVFEGTYDVLDHEILSSINADLANLPGKPQLSVEGKQAERPGIDPSAHQKRGPGVFCKSRSPYTLTLNSGPYKDTHQLSLPDPDTVHYISIPNPGWVKTNFHLEFDEQGFPLSIAIDKPSSGLAILSLPLDLLKAIIELPAKLFQLRINLNNERSTALASDLQYQQQLKTNLEEQAAMKQQIKNLQATRSFDGVTGSMPANGGGNGQSPSADAPPSEEVTRMIKKLEQDLDVMRRRFNQMQGQ
jgi:hypothetical protein